MGASFVGISPDHPLAQDWSRTMTSWPPSTPNAAKGGTTEEELEKAEKMGFDTGLRVRHPFDTAWELPVYVANFILMDYGTGAIFGCPAHDQRDLDFARKYDLPVIVDLRPANPGRFARPRTAAMPLCRPRRERALYHALCRRRDADRRAGASTRHRLLREERRRPGRDQVPPA